MQAQLAELQGKLKAKDASAAKKKTVPFLANINEDPMLSGVVVHFVEKRAHYLLAPPTLTCRQHRARSGGLEPSPHRTLRWAASSSIVVRMCSISPDGSVEDSHAIVAREVNSVFIAPANASAETRVNGKPLTTRVQLRHLDRVLFGAAHDILCTPVLIWSAFCRRIELLCVQRSHQGHQQGPERAGRHHLAVRAE